jgi:23S rRNA (adenine2030-N6)-methyltransferase
MNYRHIYHAGNFADVFKHIVLLLTLEHLQQKDKGFFVLDAFAGLGSYDFGKEAAQKTREYEGGIAKIMESSCQNPDLLRYQNVVREDWKKGRYPGSPLIAARMLRPQDHLVANELHPDDAPVLKSVLSSFENARVSTLDAYESIRANIPPTERRGLILIDPPFEKKDEFQILVRQMKEWKKRWETGCFIIWYPIKAHLPVNELHEAAKDLELHRTWVAEYLLKGRNTPDSFNGCGLLIFNTPFQLPEKVGALAPELTSCLGGTLEQRYLIEE